MTAGRSGRTRVLIVDDDGRVRDGLRQMLDSTGEFVVGAAVPDAEHARAALATDPRIDVAIVDVRLPSTRVGLDLIRDLAQIVPVLALSINGTGRSAALAAGAAIYTEKDGAPDALLAALREVVTREGARRPDERRPDERRPDLPE